MPEWRRATGPRGPAPLWTFDALLRELVDEKTYPRLHRIAWASASGGEPSEREEFLFGLDRILDGVQRLSTRDYVTHGYGWRAR